MPTVFVAPGHGEGDPGAMGKGVKEHYLATRIAVEVDNRLKASGVTVIYHPGVRDVPERIREQCKIANASGADLAMQIHMNAFFNPLANGSEVWVYAPGGRRNHWADMLNVALSNWFKPRGVKHKRFTFLAETVMPAVIIEAGFISNTKDREKVEKFAEKIGGDIATATLQELKIKPSEPPGPSPEIPEEPEPGEEWKYRVFVKDPGWQKASNLATAMRIARKGLRAGKHVEIVRVRKRD